MRGSEFPRWMVAEQDVARRFAAARSIVVGVLVCLLGGCVRSHRMLAVLMLALCGFRWMMMHEERRSAKDKVFSIRD